MFSILNEITAVTNIESLLLLTFIVGLHRLGMGRHVENVSATITTLVQQSNFSNLDV